jgi:hypothetical protein
MVIGELEEPNVFQDREGNHRASLEVTARTIKFIGNRGDNVAAGGGGFGQEPVSAPKGNNGPNGDMDLTDEDIPF